jgi:Rieske Fe-S protein
MSTGTTRRELVGGMVAAGILAGCGGRSAETVVPKAGVATISLSDHPNLAEPGGFVGITVEGRGDPILVFRAADGTLGAVSRKCTHFGCRVRFSAEEDVVACPCHGSRYEKDGSVRKGPAKTGLRRYDVEESDGRIAIRVGS